MSTLAEEFQDFLWRRSTGMHGEISRPPMPTDIESHGKNFLPPRHGVYNGNSVPITTSITPATDLPEDWVPATGLVKTNTPQMGEQMGGT